VFTLRSSAWRCALCHTSHDTRRTLHEAALKRGWSSASWSSRTSLFLFLSLCSLSPCSAPVGQPAHTSERVSASALRFVQPCIRNPRASRCNSIERETREDVRRIYKTQMLRLRRRRQYHGVKGGGISPTTRSGRKLGCRREQIAPECGRSHVHRNRGTRNRGTHPPFNIAHLSSPITRHTSHVTRHTSHVTHIILYNTDTCNHSQAWDGLHGQLIQV